MTESPHKRLKLETVETVSPIHTPMHSLPKSICYLIVQSFAAPFDLLNWIRNTTISDQDLVWFLSLLPWNVITTQPQNQQPLYMQCATLACTAGRLELVKWLHETYGICRYPGQKGGCAFYLDPPVMFSYACEHGHLELVKYLREHVFSHKDCTLCQTSCDTCDPLEDYTADSLGLASIRGHVPVVQYLCAEFRFSILDVVELALHSACEHGRLEVARFLTNNYKLTKASFRVDSNLAELFRSVCKKGDVDTAIFLAITFELTPAHAKSKYNSAMRTACKNGNLPLVQFLCSHFYQTWSNVTAENVEIMGALKNAVAAGHVEIANYLIDWFEVPAKEVIRGAGFAMYGSSAYLAIAHAGLNSKTCGL